MTIVGAVSPPGGDFSDPVTMATLGIVQVRLMTVAKSFFVCSMRKSACTAADNTAVMSSLVIVPIAMFQTV